MKTNFKRNMILSIFVILLTSPISSSFSQPPGMGMKPWRGEVNCWKASELNLSQEQMKGLDALQQSFFREAQLLRFQLFSKRLELRELLTNPNTRVEAIRSKSSEILEHQAKFEEKSLDYLIKIRNLLTQEQLKSWCPEFEFPSIRRLIQGPESMGPFPPRRPPFQEGTKPE
jgi:Spy/CpxP family protein refolding chaperone